MPSLHQLIYRSFACFDFQLDSMDSILLSCKSNNPAMNITGMLIYNDGVFLQMIEGDSLNISRLYNKISIDPRHTDLKILWKGEAEERTFPHWSMAFKDISSIPGSVLSEHQDVINQIFEVEEYDASKGYKLFKSLGATL